MNTKYSEELKIVGNYPAVTPRMPGAPKYATPITPKENFLRFFKGEKPMWMPLSSDIMSFYPNIVPDNVSRAFVMENDYIPPEKSGGPDWFGVHWDYIPMAGGSMVRPGDPKVKDICEWEKDIVFPDLSKLDWEACAARNADILSTDKPLNMTIFTGFFERLISFMDFENAATALIDEDEQDAVHSLFDKLADFYIELTGYFKKYFHLDILTLHDDWGSQRAPFFSVDTCREMIAPYIKRVVDAVHDMGLIFELHSCGFIEQLVPVIIEMGVDTWRGQPMNDKKKLVEMYGDKFIFGVQMDVPAGELDEAAMEQSVKNLIDTYGDKRVILSLYRGAPGAANSLRDMVYTATRELYENK